MGFVPKNNEVWGAYTENSITYVGTNFVGNVTSTAEFHVFEYIIFSYSSNGTVDYCGSSSTVCRFVGYHNYNLPRDRYCFIVVNPNDVDYYIVIVYSFGGSGTNAFGSSTCRSIDKSADLPKKTIPLAILVRKYPTIRLLIGSHNIRSNYKKKSQE
ncbi:6648_t:CDS:2 [Cetraspora pellucida]|uniref:6648_t:CDS:1 n=1 Tax=Cetraspora pellucida TaxID=1433469 RepID=A0A9N9AE51_9GLOM|nr:6648_t:CDS:2 [Cetraspora pellucida]